MPRPRLYKLQKYWDDDFAEYYYRLVWIYPDGDGKVVASGDENWAKRQAKHYNLTITEEE